MIVRLRPCDTSPHRVYVPHREGCQSCLCSIPFAMRVSSPLPSVPPAAGPAQNVRHRAPPGCVPPRRVWVARGVGTPAPRVQRGRRRARLEPAGWRKKGFQLPLRCFTLPLRDAMAVVDPELYVHGSAELRVADTAIIPAVVSGNPNAATLKIGERVADRVREQLRLAA